MTTLTLQQQEAITSIDSDVLVCAGAGSGKTHVLVERYIEVLRNNPSLSVSNLVAVTFTRKAANEMRTRLKARFQELSDGAEQLDFSPSGLGGERWAKCLCEIDSARIGTIHSLCESILKAFPSEAGIDPQFEVLDDLSQSELLGKAIDQALRDIIEAGGDEHEILIDYQLDDIRRWLGSVIKSWMQFEESLKSFQSLDEEDLKSHAREIIDRAHIRALRAATKDAQWVSALDYLFATAWGEPSNALEQIRLLVINNAKDISSFLSSDKDGDSLAVWGKLLEIAQIQLRAGGNKEEAKAYREVLKVPREIARKHSEKVPAALNESDSRAFVQMRSFIKLCQRTVAIYQKEKQKTLRLDYNDLISLAVKALEDSASLARRHYASSVAAILVDEFQDTNRMQSHLVSLLKGDQTRLFLIGDDKQSIYKFQGADVSTFNTWKTRLSESDCGRLLKLSQSFRSHPAVVDFVNAVFAKLMAEEEDSGSSFKASFEPLSASRKADTEAERIELVLFDATNDEGRRKAEESARLEALAVANYIVEKIQSGAPVSDKAAAAPRKIQFGDFAVLVQRNKDFSFIEGALAKKGIPYVMLAGRGFLERQEIFDMENLLAFLACPQDTHALLGALRSPLFAVGDDILHRAAQALDPAQSLFKKLTEMAQLKEPGFKTVASAMRLLTVFLSDVGVMPLADLLRKIITKTGYDLTLLALPNGRQRSRNLWKLVSLATENEHFSCADMVQSLKLMREFDVKQADAPLDSKDAVKLMTIHGSKGLEFPAVLLPVLNVPASSRKGRLIFHREFGVAFNTARDEDDERPAWFDAACGIDAEMEMAEKMRLFYVAVTRARDYLALFMDRSARDTESFRSWMKDVLKLDSRDDIWQPGRIEVEGMAQNAACYLHVLDRGDLTPEEPSLPLPSPSSNSEAAGGSLDLLEPLKPKLNQPPGLQRSSLRVVPFGLSASIDSTVVGTYFHCVMEHLPATMDKPAAEILRDLAIAQGDQVSHPKMLERLMDEGATLLEKFFASRLCSLLKSARSRHVELPYLICGDEDSKLRRPDLLFEDEAGQWHLVDYKTDHFPLEMIDTQAKLHSHQIEGYIGDLEGLLGLRLKPWVYFAQFGILHPL